MAETRRSNTTRFPLARLFSNIMVKTRRSNTTKVERFSNIIAETRRSSTTKVERFSNIIAETRRSSTTKVERWSRKFTSKILESSFPKQAKDDEVCTLTSEDLANGNLYQFDIAIGFQLLSSPERALGAQLPFCPFCPFCPNGEYHGESISSGAPETGFVITREVDSCLMWPNWPPEFFLTPDDLPHVFPGFDPDLLLEKEEKKEEMDVYSFCIIHVPSEYDIFPMEDIFLRQEPRTRLESLYAVRKEEFEEFERIMREGEGFEYVRFPGPLGDYYAFREVPTRCLKGLTGLTELGMEDYNKKNGTEFVVEQVEKANTSCPASIVCDYFITFTGKDERGSLLKTFQTKVCENWDSKETWVEFCREKP